MTVFKRGMIPSDMLASTSDSFHSGAVPMQVETIYGSSTIMLARDDRAKAVFLNSSLD